MPNLTIALAMGIIRLISGSIEVLSACLMIYFNKVETAVKINALLAVIGPTVLVVVTSLGVMGIADKVPPAKMFIILCGVALIFIGLHKI